MKDIFKFLLFSAIGLSYEAACAQKPNVILIMTDDQGYGDFGFTGNPYVKTPHIDALSARSVQLTNYHNSPVCAPTRASLLTGRYAQRTGVHDTYNNGAIMATEEVTLAEILGGNGYKTGIVGKWHLGDNYPFRASDQGFQYTLVHGGGGVGQPGDLIENFTRKDSSYFNTVFTENGKKVYRKGYCTDIFTDQAVHFLQENKDKPFFLYVSYNAPHDPLQLPEKYKQMYNNLKFDTDFDKQTGSPWAAMNDKDKENARKVYGMISNLDDNVGRILGELKNQKLDKNTIVIFLTDNGNQQLRYNTGFRGLKGSVYEGGTRCPFLISGAGIFPEGKKVDALVAHIDVLPTVLEALKIPLPNGLKTDGESALPYVLATRSQKERIFYNAWNRGWPEPYRNAAVYRGTHKLVAVNASLGDQGAFSLFDLAKDPFEKNNLIATERNMSLKLRKTLDSLFADISGSPHLTPRRIVIGSPHENPTMLTRQDLAGTSVGSWIADQFTGYWTVTVQRDGYYNFKSIHIKPITKGTRAVVRLGQIQRSKLVIIEENSVVLDNIFLKAGDYNIEAWFEGSGGVMSPYYLEAGRVRN